MEVITLSQTASEVEQWDDAYEFDSHHSLDRLFDQLHHHLPRSPLSDSSDQSDYFQQRPHQSKRDAAARGSVRHSSYTHALPSPPTTTTATTLLSSRTVLTDFGADSGASHYSFKRLVASAEAPSRPDQRLAPASNVLRSYSAVSTAKASVLSPSRPNSSLLLSMCSRGEGVNAKSTQRESRLCQSSSRSSPSPVSSTTSSPRAITSSVASPSTTGTVSGSMIHKEVKSNGRDKDKDLDVDKDGKAGALIARSMTTITQEMMQSNLPAYTGIITRINPINPIKRVAAWVDDLEDLEVPEEELDFSHVRTILAKSTPVPETLDSADNWDTDSDNSISRGHSTPSMIHAILPGDYSGVWRPEIRSTGIVPSETIETLDDDFDLPDDLGSLRLHLRMQDEVQRYNSPSDPTTLRREPSLLQWQDSGSDIDDFEFGLPLDNHSMSSSASYSRDSVGDDDNILDGIIFPDTMDDLQLVTNRPYRPETAPFIFGKDSRFQEEQDDFWNGLDIGGDDLFNRKGRNKNVIVRVAPLGRERNSSRVQRQVVPLKDFVALPSRIPRLCRAPGDTSRPVTPASSLSRMHSTQFELPLRNLRSKSSLPRLTRTNISENAGVRALHFPLGSDAVVLSSESSSAYSSPAVSRAPTPTTSKLSNGKRNSLLINKDDFPSFKSSSLAMRSVTFTEPKGAVTSEESDLKASVSQSAASAASDMPAHASLAQTPPAPYTNGKSLPSLRSLVKRFDFTRPRFSGRGLLPVFEPAAPPAMTQTLGLPSFLEHDDCPRGSRSPRSRSSSITDWSSIIASTETTKSSRSPSRAGLVSLGDISEISTTDVGESVSPVAASERFSRRLFLKRSPKHGAFGDGSELDRFDNLHTFGSQDFDTRERMKAQVRKQSTDRVAAWLRKPQSIANLKEVSRPQVSTNVTEPSSSTNIRKSKSIRKSLFDIFGQAAALQAPKGRDDKCKDEKLKEQPGKERPVSKDKRKRRKTPSGPTLIRDLSQSRVRKVSGMVYNPKDKMWNGNDDVLDDFEDDERMAMPFDSPSPPQAHTHSPSSPVLGATRPALISNMSQYSKQRTQVAGKMIFDPAKMCWIVNPEYISRRLRHKQDNHRRQQSLDEAWGDELDVFAGLSDSEGSHNGLDGKHELEGESQVQVQDQEWRREGTFSSSIDRSKDGRLRLRPSFYRHQSQEHFAEDERLKVWAETLTSQPCQESSEARQQFAGTHSIVPKSSRKSLNGAHHAGCSNGISGGGYSSRGEFEVGVEFDMTDAFLEQCISAEAQHRKDAGKFFALPCTPAVSDPFPTRPSRLSKMASVKMLPLRKDSLRSKTQSRQTDKERGLFNIRKKEKEEKNHADVGDKADKQGLCERGSTENASDNDCMTQRQKRKTTKFLFPRNAMLSWPPRSKSKSQSTAVHVSSENSGPLCSGAMGSIRNDQGPVTASSFTKTSIHESNLNDQTDGNNSKASPKSRNMSKSKSFGRASLFAFASSYSSTSSASPAAATLAARGRGGLHDVHFHRLPTKHGSMGGTLSFTATLAVARRGARSYDRRRIGNHTFDPLDSSKYMDGGQGGNAARRQDIVPHGLEEEDEDDLIERGYSAMSKARGRPPLLAKTELLVEFDRHTGPRYS
ncbi:hypothetical protein EDD11_005089 [Mortierella claussenii]|nr:hypothetical protein EDD11_005089 [Mortierella claussenii]